MPTAPLPTVIVIHSAAKYLNGRGGVAAEFSIAACEEGFLPRLPENADYEIAKRELAQFGGMISFEMGSFEKSKRVLNNVKLCALAASLGDCETLIQRPASMTSF